MFAKVPDWLAISFFLASIIWVIIIGPILSNPEHELISGEEYFATATFLLGLFLGHFVQTKRTIRIDEELADASVWITKKLRHGFHLIGLRERINIHLSFGEVRLKLLNTALENGLSPIQKELLEELEFKKELEV